MTAGTSGIGNATSIITASFRGVSGQTTLVVSSPTLTSITVTPASPSIPVGVTHQFNATGTYSDGSTLDLTRSVTWASADTTQATIASSGLATAIAAGSSAITAAKNGVRSPAVTLTVTTATLTSIAVTPGGPSIPAGATQLFTATGTYSDGSTLNLTTSVTWHSADTTKATIASSGLATAVAAGTSAITAARNGVTSPAATLTITTATLTSIAVTAATPAVPAGATQQFTATGTYSDGSTLDLTASVTWHSADATKAIIASSGLATAVAAGTSSITAAKSGVTSPPITLTVSSVLPTSISVTPANPTVQVGVTVQLKAAGNYPGGSVQDLTSGVTWTSGSPGVATVSGGGLATGVAANSGALTLYASNPGQWGNSLRVSVKVSSGDATPAAPRFCGSCRRFRNAARMP
jgi:hypothetical protein